MSNDLRLWILGNSKTSKNTKTSWNYCLIILELVLSPPPKIKTLSVLEKVFWKTEIELRRSTLFHMKTRVCLKYFVNHYLWKQFLNSNSPHTPSSLICLTIFVNLRTFTQSVLAKKIYDIYKFQFFKRITIFRS